MSNIGEIRRAKDIGRRGTYKYKGNKGSSGCRIV